MKGNSVLRLAIAQTVSDIGSHREGVLGVRPVYKSAPRVFVRAIGFKGIEESSKVNGMFLDILEGLFFKDPREQLFDILS